MKILTTITHRNYIMKLKRKEMGITQKQLADRVGVGQTVISEIELLRDVSGVRNIDLVLVDVADNLDLPFNEIFPIEYLDALYEDMLPRKQQYLFDISIEQLESHAGIGKDTRRFLLPDGGTQHVEEEADNDKLEALFLELLTDKLKPREERIIRLRFGFDGNKAHTFEETAKKMGVTRERIRQMEAQALRRLRGIKSQRKLRPYMDPDSAIWTRFRGREEWFRLVDLWISLQTNGELTRRRIEDYGYDFDSDYATRMATTKSGFTAIEVYKEQGCTGSYRCRCKECCARRRKYGVLWQYKTGNEGE